MPVDKNNDMKIIKRTIGIIMIVAIGSALSYQITIDEAWEIILKTLAVIACLGIIIFILRWAFS